MTEGRIFAYGEPGVFLITGEDTGNTGDGGDIPLTVVNPSNSSRIQYYNGPGNDGTDLNPLTEETYIRFSAVSGEINEIRKTTPPMIRGAFQACFSIYQLSSSLNVYASARSADGVGTAIEARMTSGNFAALNANALFDTVATAYVAGVTRYCHDVWFEVGTATNNGKAKQRLRTINNDGTLTTVHNGALFMDRNTGIQGTNNPESFRWGKLTSTSTLGLKLFEYAWDDGALDYCSDPITGICGSDQEQEPWTTAELHAKGLGTWSQIAGPAVVLSGTQKDKTYPVPKTLDGTSLTFSYGRDVTTNTVKGATDRIVDPATGLWVPVRFISVGSVFP